MTRPVLDASAILADLHREPGGEIARAARLDGLVSAVNYSEVVAKLVEQGVRGADAVYLLDRIGYEVVPVDRSRAALAGELHAETFRSGVSLGDRFCLALARELGAPLLTTDRRLSTADLDIEVVLIR